jgi:hypothetical protein
VVSKRRARSEIFNQKVETPEISPKIQWRNLESLTRKKHLEAGQKKRHRNMRNLCRPRPSTTKANKVRFDTTENITESPQSAPEPEKILPDDDYQDPSTRSQKCKLVLPD